jgi:hypothetical protein
MKPTGSALGGEDVGDGGEADALRQRGNHRRGGQQRVPLLRDDDGHGEGAVGGGELAAHDEHGVDVAAARVRHSDHVPSRSCRRRRGHFLVGSRVVT